MSAKRTSIGINVHDTEKLSVVARDIDYFWTLQVTGIDAADGGFVVDWYVNKFDADQMEAFALALEKGADGVRALAKAKTPCKHQDLEMREVATCVDCKERFDIFDGWPEPGAQPVVRKR